MMVLTFMSRSVTMSLAESSRGGSLNAMRPTKRSGLGNPAATAMTR
jgi:hypothetical protein